MLLFYKTTIAEGIIWYFRAFHMIRRGDDEELYCLRVFEYSSWGGG